MNPWGKRSAAAVLAVLCGLARASTLIAAETLDAPAPVADAVALTLDSLRDELSGEEFVLDYYDGKGLKEALAARHPLFFITNPVTFTAISEKTGAWALATLKSPQARDGAHTTGAAFAVRADSSISTLTDLKGAKAAAISTTAYESYLIGMNEIHRVFGQNEVFKSVVLTGSPIEEVAYAVLSGKADVGILDACVLERMEAGGNIGRGSLRVIAQRHSRDLQCRHSTELYPGWVLSVSRPKAQLTDAQKALIAAVSRALVKVPNLGYTMQWAEPMDRRDVLSLLAEVQRPAAAAMSLKKFLADYSGWILSVLAAVLALVCHSFYVGYLVRRRTRQLTIALAERDRIEHEAQGARERLDNMERAGAVGQLSSMIAHELQQPLNAVINFAEGLRVRFEKGTLEEDDFKQALGKITSQARQAALIVSRVRGYGRTRVPIHRREDLCAIARTAVHNFEASRSLGFSVAVQLPERAGVEADALEIELLIFNLLKNAAEALEGIENPALQLKVARHLAAWRLSVSDNGKSLPKEAMERFFEPKPSRKSNGLGLGLAICRRIAESHAGRLWVEPHVPQGLCVILELPEMEEGQPS